MNFVESGFGFLHGCAWVLFFFHPVCGLTDYNLDMCQKSAIDIFLVQYLNIVLSYFFCQSFFFLGRERCVPLHRLKKCMKNVIML